MKNALIVAETGPLLDGLQALLAEESKIDTVTIANSLATVLDYASEMCPTFILLVIESLDDSQKAILAAIRDHCAETPILGLVDSEEMYLSASNLGIHVVFIRGSNVRELSRSIENMLNV